MGVATVYSILMQKKLRLGEAVEGSVASTNELQTLVIVLERLEEG